MNYQEMFWYSFLNDFPDQSSQEESWNKQRLANVLEGHKQEAANRIKVEVEGELYSH